MIMPNKSIRPVDSIIYKSSFILNILTSEELSFDSLYQKVNDAYEKTMTLEDFMLCINFLFLIGKIGIDNETDKIKL